MCVCVCVCVCVCMITEDSGMVGNGCDLLKLHCDPLGFQQPRLHASLTH